MDRHVLRVGPYRTLPGGRAILVAGSAANTRARVLRTGSRCGGARSTRLIRLAGWMSWGTALLLIRNIARRARVLRFDALIGLILNSLVRGVAAPARGRRARLRRSLNIIAVKVRMCFLLCLPCPIYMQDTSCFLAFTSFAPHKSPGRGGRLEIRMRGCHAKSASVGTDPPGLADSKLDGR